MRADPRWRGGDAAYSVALADGRVLWLFGDSFVGEGDGTEGRGGRAMVRNTVALQSGANPATSSFSFAHRTTDTGEPSPFFAPMFGLDLWPGPASRIGDGLLLTFVRIRSTEADLGFETVDSLAFRVPDTAGMPAAWTFEPTELPAAPPGVQLGYGAHLADPRWTYAFAPVEPGNHDIYLGRWAADDLTAGHTERMQWWSGSAWQAEPSQARVIVGGLQTEFSVTRVGEELWMVSTDTFGASDIVVRTAAAPEGPWSPPRQLYRPPEFGRDGVLIYSAKAHAHLEGGPQVLTYCTNRLDFWDLAADMDVYFPRFVRVTPR